MDKIERYRQSIKQLLANHTKGYKAPDSEEYSEQLIIDDVNGHYLLMGCGLEKIQTLTRHQPSY